MKGHPVIVTKFDHWAEQPLGRVVKGIEVRASKGVTVEVNHWNKGLGIWSTLRWNADVQNMCTLCEPLTALKVGARKLLVNINWSQMSPSRTLRAALARSRSLRTMTSATSVSPHVEVMSLKSSPIRVQLELKFCDLS